MKQHQESNTQKDHFNQTAPLKLLDKPGLTTQGNTKVQFKLRCTSSLAPHSLLGGLVDQGLVDVRDDASTCNGALDEGVELLISTDGQLKVARGDTLNLQILASIPSQLQNLSSQVLQDGSRVDSCSGTNTTICLSPLLKLAVDTANRELKMPSTLNISKLIPQL